MYVDLVIFDDDDDDDYFKYHLWKHANRLAFKLIKIWSNSIENLIRRVFELIDKSENKQ